MFVVEVDARAGTISTRTVKFDKPNMDWVFQDAEKIRGNTESH